MTISLEYSIKSIIGNTRGHTAGKKVMIHRTKTQGNSNQTQKSTGIIDHPRDITIWYMMVICWKMWTSLLTGSVQRTPHFTPDHSSVFELCQLWVCSLWKQKSVSRLSNEIQWSELLPNSATSHTSRPSAPNIPEHLQPNQSQWPDTGSHRIPPGGSQHEKPHHQIPSKDLKSLGKKHLLKAIFCFWDLRSFPFDSFCIDDWNIYLFIQPILSWPTPLGPAWKTLMWSSFLIWIWAFRKTGLVRGILWKRLHDFETFRMRMGRVDKDWCPVSLLKPILDQKVADDGRWVHDDLGRSGSVSYLPKQEASKTTMLHKLGKQLRCTGTHCHSLLPFSRTVVVHGNPDLEIDQRKWLISRNTSPSSHNHGSQKLVPPIIVSFQIH